MARKSTQCQLSPVDNRKASHFKLLMEGEFGDQLFK